MEPSTKRNARPNRNLVLGTVLLLVVAFAALIVLFYVFSELSPSLLGRCVAVVDISVPLTVEGIPPSLFDAGMPGSEEIATTIESLDEREDIGAVVFVINSPGGSVVATHEVYDAIKNLEKPKVAYFRETAASGGYYIATGTDYIISDPDAITGSIGVVATVTQMSGLLDKLGVNVTSITSGEHKDIGSPFRNMTDEENAILQAVVDEIYQEFESVVIENRGKRLDRTQFAEITDGRILTGRQAVKIGLVDKTGNKKDAIMKAAELAEIPAESYDDIQICYVPVGGEPAGLFSAEALVHQLTAKEGVQVSYR